MRTVRAFANHFSRYERLIKSGKEITAGQISSFFDVAASKCMLELVKAMIDRFHPVPTITQFLDYCLPPKPDHPEVDKYIFFCEKP